MQAVSNQMAAFIRSQIKTPAVYAKVQLTDYTGQILTSQLVLSNLTGCKLSRTQDRSSDVASFTLVDNTSAYSSLNKQSKYGICFSPGVIDTKVILYMGFRNI